MNNVTLNPGMFSTCSVHFDKYKNSLDYTDITEISNCCNNKCSKPYKFCHEYCINNYGGNKEVENPELINRCIGRCKYNKNLCYNTCSIINTETDFYLYNNYVDCATKNNCIEYSSRIQNKDCLRKNKEQILHCCRNSCIPTSMLDCDKQCEYLHRKVLNSDIII